MPVVYADTLKRSRLNAVTTAIDAGPAEGYISIGTGPASPWAFGTKLVDIDLDDPSFAAAATAGAAPFASSIAMTVPPGGLSGQASATGVAVVAQILDSNDVVVVSGLVVGTAIGAGVEIALSATAISSGQTVTITQGTITHG